jgi:hypothetical protein
MKKYISFLPVLLFLSFIAIPTELSRKEKKFAVGYLEETRDYLFNTISGLTEEQLNFKPAEDRWSIRECIQHISLSEVSLRELLDASLNKPANPEKKGEIKVTDDQMIRMYTDRSSKFKAPETLNPVKSAFTTTEALNNFKMNREKLIKFVKHTKLDLRGYISPSPAGMMDAYQWVLAIGAHSNRHTQQIAEVKSHPNFPK